MNVGVIITIAACIVFLAVKSIYDTIMDKRLLDARLYNQWGKYPDKEYVPGKLESIKLYYESNASDGDIDDITCNDLDMDELYKMLNHTESSMGEEILYNIVRKPLRNREDIEDRKRAAQFLSENTSDRLLLQRNLSKIGVDKKYSFYEYFERLAEVKTEGNLFHYMINILVIGSVAGIIMNCQPFIFVLIPAVIVAIISYYKRKAEIEAYYFIFGSVLKMLYCTSDIAANDIAVFDKQLAEIREAIKSFKQFKRNSGIVLKQNGGNLSDILLDYIRMITHIDLIKFNNMYRIVMDNRDKLLSIHKNVGYIDAMIAIASFRDMISDRGWCEPEFVDEKRYLEFEEAFHPFLENPVYNSFHAGNSVLVTGSNASGKSTFLKMTAVNAILSQTVVTAAAKSYKTSFYKIMTSMALNDNIFGSESYFIVEIMSLKRILDGSENEAILCCIDEVLRGTNTIERIAASSRILKTLSESNTLCFAATHDIELAHILSKYFDNYHFREKIEEEDVIFDYKIYDGFSKTKNAIRLLNMLGYDREIVKEADEMAAAFERDNRWQQI